jgi:hypothetical protein
LKPLEFDAFKNESVANSISLTTHVWGDKLIEQLAKDLKEEFPDLKGFSSSNLIFANQQKK